MYTDGTADGLGPEGGAGDHRPTGVDTPTPAFTDPLDPEQSSASASASSTCSAAGTRGGGVSVSAATSTPSVASDGADEQDEQNPVNIVGKMVYEDLANHNFPVHGDEDCHFECEAKNWK